MDISINRFNSSVLNNFASYVSSRNASVVVTNRLRSANMAIVLCSNTIALDSSATLLDLVIGATMLRFGGSTLRTELKACKNFLTKSRSQEIVCRAIAFIRLRFPGLLAKWDGRFHPNVHLLPGYSPPKLSWKKMPYKKLLASDLKGGASAKFSGGYEITGADDITALIEAIANGAYPLETHEDMPEIPIARVEVSLNEQPNDFAQWEIFERSLNENEEFAREIAECLASKIVGLEENRRDDTFQFQGSRIDPGRLTLAHIYAERGLEFPVFRQASHQIINEFWPDQHVFSFAMCLNSLHEVAGNGKRLATRTIFGVLQALTHLDVPIALTMFCDRLIHVNGREVYVHMPIEVQREDSRFDKKVFWQRIFNLLGERNLPGKPASCTSLCLDTSVLAVASRVDDPTKHLSPFMYFNHAMEASETLADTFPLRMAHSVESRLQRLLKGSRNNTSWFYENLGWLGVLPYEIIVEAERDSLLGEMKSLY